MFKNMTMKTRIIGVAVLFGLIAFFSPTEKEKNEKEKNEIVKLESEVLKIPALNINKNLEAYTKLSNYYKDNEKYKNKYEKYKELDSIQSYCLEASKDLNIKSLKNSNSYNNETYKFSKWISPKEFITNFTFTGKNAFGVEYKFNSQYKCEIKKAGTTIETIFIKQL